MNSFSHRSYQFQVEWKGTKIEFLEVSGLNMEIAPLEDQRKTIAEFSKTKISEIKKYDNIIFKRRINDGGNEFYEWINSQKIKQIDKKDLTISLLNEDRKVLMVWEVRNCFPIRYIGPSLTSEDNILSESLIISHDGWVMKKLSSNKRQKTVKRRQEQNRLA